MLMVNLTDFKKVVSCVLDAIKINYGVQDTIDYFMKLILRSVFKSAVLKNLLKLDFVLVSGVVGRSQ